jgi:hypothetical protein
MATKPKYHVDPKEVYTLELEKLQLAFAEMQKVSADASELPRVTWRHVDHLRHMTFIVMEAVQTRESLLQITS